MTREILIAIRALIESIHRDEQFSGGLLSRETLRLAAELFIALEAAREASQ
jgi:hypothetical protein